MEKFLYHFRCLGLSVFTIAAGMKAIESNYNFMTFLFVSVITAVGGGVIRDVLAQASSYHFKTRSLCRCFFNRSNLLLVIHPILGIT